MRWLLPLLWVTGSCSYVFDHSPPDLPLVGSPPPISSLKKFNRTPADDVGIVAGRDRAYWVYAKEGPSYHLTRLSPPEREEDLTADQIYVTFRAFYLLDFGDHSMAMDGGDGGNGGGDGGTPDGGAAHPGPTTRLVVRSAGESAGATFKFPQGTPLLVSGGNDTVFAYLVTNPNQGYYELVHRDGSMRRGICLEQVPTLADCFSTTRPPAQKLDSTSPRRDGGFFFNSSGTLFFDRYPDKTVVAHLTNEERDYPPFQMPPDQFYYYDRLQSFVTCAKEEPAVGLRLFHITDGESVVLDPSPCEQIVAFSDSEAYYLSPVTDENVTNRSTLWAVPFAGGPPRVAYDRPIAQLLSFGPTDDQLLYSLDSPNRYVYGEGDGWLGDWRFMERGRAAGFSFDGKRLRWLEHATTDNGVGDLYSAPIGSTPIRLARNVRQFNELSDGRVVATANRAFRGVQSRIVVIDEQAGVSQWVLDSATSYQFIPGSSDLLAEVVTGPATADYVRVSLPPKHTVLDAGAQNK